MTARRRTAALLEVLGVFLASPLVMTLLIRASGLQLANPLQGFTAGITDAELIAATGQIVILLMLQYAGYFLLIIPINWWHRRCGPAEYGLTRAGRSWAALLLAGIATAALAAWPAVSVMMVDAVYELGETVPWRQAVFDTSWRRWEFWLFMSVVSFALVPVLEELFFRGYCQRRLAEDWGDGPAIVGTALLFVCTHGQYLMLNAYNVSMIVSLLVLAIAFGVVFAWTKSLIPSIVAHAIINVPMSPIWQGVLVGTSVIGALFMARRGLAVVKHVFMGASLAGCVLLGLAGAGWAIAAQRIGGLEYVAAVMMVSAVGLEVASRSDRVIPKGAEAT
jgi:membrane protease YdiL (CAAX protease family)